MKLGIISGPPTFSRLISFVDVPRVEHFVDGDVVLIDTSLTRYTFMVRRAGTCAGTLGGGDFYDPVWAVLLGRPGALGKTRASHLQVGSEALFQVSVDGFMRAHPLPDVVRLQTVRRRSLDFAGAARARW